MVSKRPLVFFDAVNGRGDTAVLGLQDYKQMKAELELLRTLAEAEDDVQNGRVGSMQESFDDLRESLVNRKNENVLDSKNRQAEDQLRDIIYYIVDDSGNIDTINPSLQGF